MILAAPRPVVDDRAATPKPENGQAARGNEIFLKAGALQSAIFNSANFSSIATDAKGVIQIFNVGAERMLGYTAEEVLNKITPAAFSDPREIIVRAEALSVELQTQITPGFEALVFKASRGIEDIYELSYIRKDGSRFPAVVSVTALRDAQDDIIGYLLIGTDNTARKHAEQRLLKADALQRAIFDSANFSSIATDARGVIQIFNVGAERMLGYTAAEMLNKITPADISDPQEMIARASALSDELATPIAPGFEALVFKASRGIEDIYELTYIRKDGSRFPAVVSVTALRDAELVIIGYLLIGTDNSTRKQIEAEQTQLAQRLRDHQFYTRSLFESNIDALMTTDTPGIITDVNKQMEALTGCTRDELIGAPFKNFFTDPGRAEAGIKLALSKRKITDYELTARNRDGKETAVSYNATTLYDRDRRLQGVFAAVREITERKQYERSLRELNTTLERRVLISTSELKEREAMLQEIHHRVKNNLQVISSLINMQVRRLTDTSSCLALQECQSRVQAMALIHEMLYQSKNYSSVQFSSYTRSLAANIFHATGVSQAIVGLDLSIEDLSLAVDKAIPCGLILNELISNALKHAFPNERRGMIHVKLCKISNRDIILSVADDGIGLPVSFDMEKLNSLGMQLVATLVEQLEGHLEITRAKGTVFSVTFSAMAPS